MIIQSCQGDCIATIIELASDFQKEKWEREQTVEGRRKYSFKNNLATYIL